MKKLILFFMVILLSLSFTTCDNFFHDLIPPDGNSITSFYVNGQVYVEIDSYSVTAFVLPSTNLDSLIPFIRVSEGATLFPVTREYITRAFKDERTFGAAMQLYAGGNITDTLIDMISMNKDFERPVINLPIDFTYPVDFLVISGLGSVRRYTVRVLHDTGEGKFTSFKFDKFFNPDLVRSTTGSIDTATNTVTINVSYPVENIASYELIPTFTTNNARVYLNGVEVQTDTSLLSFLKPPDSSDLSNPMYSTQELTLTLSRSGYPDAEWKLIVNFSEDPDTIRSIIDFRFTKTRNPLIAADYMAEIINTADTGTINVTVYYSGTKPDELRPDFVSPGTVTVNGVTQTSGFNYHDFSSPIYYVVTSRVGSLVRTYTVNVNLVPVSDPLPVISSFVFTTDKNPHLILNTSAMIDHNAKIILIEAIYQGVLPSKNLIPEFSATGNVTVNGAAQTSGTTSNNFSNFVYYTVTNPSNPTLKREYRVEVIFTESLAAVAEITSFNFYKADNPNLIDDVTATIDQATGEITATLLFDTPGGNRMLVPRWTSQGTIVTGGITITSGTPAQFYGPQNFRAVSIDGSYIKNYTVRIKEVNSRIYVKANATGRNDGTNWANAYTNMPNACDDTTLLPETLSKEIWIAEGTYTPSDRGNIDDYLIISSNTSYIGGFAGHETSVSGRTNPNNHKATISGDLGGGRRSNNLFTGKYEIEILSYEYFVHAPVNGDFSFEYLSFVKANANRVPSNGSAIHANIGSNFIAKISNCIFNDLQTRYVGVICLEGLGNIIINNTFIDNCTGGVYVSESSSINIVDTKITNVLSSSSLSEYGIYGCSNGNITIEQVSIDGISGTGIHIFSSGSSIKSFLIRNSIIRNINRGGGIMLGGNNTVIDIEGTTIENAVAFYQGGGLSVPSYNIGSNVTITISDTNFINCTAGSGGYYISQHTEFTTFKNCNFIHNDNFVVSDTLITVFPGSLFSPTGVFENCTFTNLRSNNIGEDYLFNNHLYYPSSNRVGTIRENGGNLRLINCTFNFNSGSAGLLALIAGQNNPSEGWATLLPNNLLMDGCTINNNGGQQPLFWFWATTGSTPGTFRFRPNNTYNGTLLDTADSFTGLQSSGIIRLEQGAMPTLVP